MPDGDPPAVDPVLLAQAVAGNAELQARMKPLLERESRAQERSELLGNGQISEEDRKNLRKDLAELSFKCKPSQFLALKKAVELCDVSQVLEDAGQGLLKWTPLSFIAAAFANKLCSKDKAKNLQRAYETTVTGDISRPVDQREATVEEDTVKKTFWRVCHEVFHENALPEVPDLTVNPDAETEPQRYARQVKAAFDYELLQGFRADIKSVRSQDETKLYCYNVVDPVQKKAQEALTVAKSKKGGGKNQNPRERDARRETAKGGGKNAQVCEPWLQNGVCPDGGAEGGCPHKHFGPIDLLARISRKKGFNLTSKILAKRASAVAPPLEQKKE
eukprot:g1156.t1